MNKHENHTIYHGLSIVLQNFVLKCIDIKYLNILGINNLGQSQAEQELCVPVTLKTNIVYDI